VLGAVRGAAAPLIVTAIDTKTGAMFARNPWNADFGERVALPILPGGRFPGPATAGSSSAATARSTSRPRSPARRRCPTMWARPGSLRRAADQAGIAGERGGRNRLPARRDGVTGSGQALIEKYRTADLVAVLAKVTRFWDDTVGTVQVKTPDRAMDIMLNRWLLYQTLSCRVWARAAFYQASGAYGFRDQLQDVMALCVAPLVARAHLLRAAARQFAEGDVQHWWLPESGRGIRTRISDDRVWLAYVAAHYVAVTGDTAVLDERVAVSRRASLARRRERGVLCARGRRPPGFLVRALRAGAGPESRGRQPRAAADRHRGLERRHEPGRRARQRREHLARLAVARHADRVRDTGDSAAEQPRALRRGGCTLRHCNKPSNATDGTATGIAAPISTMARRSARRKTTNAASTRSRSHGR
jgi:hypothetical protein